MRFSYKKLFTASVWGVLSLVYSFSQMLYISLNCKVVCEPTSYSFLEIVGLATIGLPGFVATTALLYLKDYLPIFDTPITQGNLWPVFTGISVSVGTAYLIIYLLSKALIFYRKKK